MLEILQKIIVISFTITCIALLLLFLIPNKKKSKQSKVNNEELIMKNETKSVSVINVLQDKILQNGNKPLYMITLGKSTNTSFTLSSNGTGIQVKQLPNFILEWEHFDKIIKKANALGGKMYRGDTLAQSNKKLGKEIPHDCMEGFIAKALLNTEDGKSVTRRSTYYSGILAWAGIITLHKSQGKGSFITVNPDFRNIL